MSLTFKSTDFKESRLLFIMWWALSNQLKALREKTKVSKEDRILSPDWRLQKQLFPGLQPAGLPCSFQTCHPHSSASHFLK